MKYVYLIVFFMSIFLLIGCLGISKNKNDLKIKENNDFEISIGQLETYGKRDSIEKDPPKHVFKVKVQITNNAGSERGIGSLDFKAFDQNGKEIPHYGYGDNFGEVVGISKTVKGTMFFSGNINSLDRIEYTNPDTKKTTNWKLAEISTK